MIIPLSLSKEEAERFRKFANMQNRTLTEMIRSVVEEKIQDEEDWQTYKEALVDYQIHGKLFSLAVVKRERGIR